MKLVTERGVTVARACPGAHAVPATSAADRARTPRGRTPTSGPEQLRKAENGVDLLGWTPAVKEAVALRPALESVRDCEIANAKSAASIRDERVPDGWLGRPDCYAGDSMTRLREAKAVLSSCCGRAAISGLRSF